MNSTNNDFYKNAALKVFAQLGQLIEEDENKPKQINVLDSSTVILKDDKPFKFDLSIMPNDVVSCIGKHLEDYPFEIYKDTELYKMFFKYDRPDDYKEYIKYISDIKNNKTYEEYDFTESCKTDINFLLLIIKKYYKELKIKTYEIKFKHEKYTERGCEDEITERFAASLISALAFSIAGVALVKSASTLLGRTVMIGVPFETFECTVVDPPNTN